MQQIADISVFEGLQANAHESMGYGGLGVFNDTAIENLAKFKKDLNDKKHVDPNKMSPEQLKQKGEVERAEQEEGGNLERTERQQKYASEAASLAIGNIPNNTGDAALHGQLAGSTQDIWGNYSKDFFRICEQIKKSATAMKKLEKGESLELSETISSAINEIYFIGDKAKHNPNSKEDRVKGQRVLDKVRVFYPQIDTMFESR